MQTNLIPINVLTLCMGTKYNVLSYKGFKEYTLLRCLSESETMRAIDSGLFDTTDIIEFEEKISILLHDIDEMLLQKESEKWLYVALKQLKNDRLSKENLLNKIADIYATFDYPLSMQHAVNYMPADIDLSNYTIEQAQNRLIALYDTFLHDLEKKLTE